MKRVDHNVTSDIIHYAFLGDIEKLKALHLQGVSLFSENYDKRTPLHLAASEGHLEVVEFLLDCKVDPNPIDRFGNTPVMDSIRHRHHDVTKFLVSRGGRISHEGGPLRMANYDICQASKEGDLVKVQSLVESSTDVNTSDVDSRTALHIAAAEGSFEIAQYLLNCHANVNAVDRWGVTPIKEAISKNHQNIVDLFQASGAITVDVSKIQYVPTLFLTMQQVLIMLCEKHKWIYGAAWVYTDDRKSLYPSDAWYSDGHYVSRIAQYHHSQGPIPFGCGIVGNCAKSKTPNWLETSEKLQKVVYSPNPILECGFRSGLVIPVLYNSETLVVLEFFSFSERPTNEGLIKEAMRTATSAIVSEVLSNASQLDKPSVSSIKSEQSLLVFSLVLKTGTFTESTVSKAVEWYYQGLGLPTTYFKIHSPHLIAKHIMAYMTATLHSRDSGSPFSYRLEEEDYGLYFTEASRYTRLVEVERRIEERYLGEGYLETKDVKKHPIPTAPTSTSTSTPTQPPRHLTPVTFTATNRGGMAVQFYLSTGTVDPMSTSKLAMYLVSRDQFVKPDAREEETEINVVATGAFLRDVDEKTREKFQRAIIDNISSMTVGINWEPQSPFPGFELVLITYRKETTHSYHSSLTTLMHIHKLECNYKTTREFSNGLIQDLLYVKGTKEDILKFREQANLLYILPRTSLFPLLDQEKLNVEEVVYAYAGWKFVYHFLNKASEEFSQLWESLKDNEINRNRLLRLKQTIRNEAAAESKVQEVIMNYPELIKDFYAYFRNHFQPRSDGTVLGRPTTHNLALTTKIYRTVPNILDCQILDSFLVFNEYILKTNFYKSAKSALSIQMDPSFLPSDYPRMPYSIILILGAEFRGFHVRFEQISRGGIRLIKSANFQSFVKNLENVFAENYNLAYTQQNKNKDIPEGGSKGTILLSMTQQNKSQTAFRKYIDSLLDLLLVNQTQKDPEIDDLIFCGPDEGTADYMDWAALHAKRRGYKYWSAFTTGKSTKLGGIPHDVYGMTTRGVHQYVIGLMKKKGITEEQVLKVQTGGPDGDLGSNEILISKDKTKAVVDGSGVLFDKNGIDREELRRLAKSRKMVENFDKKKLSKDGFLVLIGDRDVVLPDGNVIENGMNFRNSFHLTSYASCDFFVPCGGRPESVSIQNVNKIFINGEPIFKNIIEGANLFFTQEARLVLEAAGVPVLKDASANKGGVTSSSLEVLAALCFTNDEHEKHMCVKNGLIPQFYKDYVVEVQKKIEENAQLEFECIWNEWTKTKIPMSTISDKISEKINHLNETISNSKLWEQEKIKNKLLIECLPRGLLDLLGLEEIVKRLPPSYISATLSANLASRYIYKFGLNPGEFSFYEFMQNYA